MGRRFLGGVARQRPDLSDDVDDGTHPVLRIVVLTLLAIDGVLCALMAALFLPSYLGAIPFPISAVLAGLVNLVLVWAAKYWAAEPRLAALPLWTWLATVMLLMVGGPGSDVVFGGTGAMGLVLVLVGAGPAAWWLWRPQTAAG